MTAPTHAAFGVLCAALAGTGRFNAIACALGALLPDIDHPQSSIGRILFFISHPLNQRFGHRQLIHSFAIWTPLLLAGMVANSPLVFWIGTGAISHIIIDSYTVSGVKAFLPFSDRSMIFFKRDWRIYTGSVQEIILCCIFVILICAADYSYAIGGPRKLINLLARSHKITVEEYTRAGLKFCTVKGQFRWADGRLEDVEWPVVGMEGQKLVYWDGQKLIRDGKQGKFLKSILNQTDRNWPVAKVAGLVKVKSPAFFFDGKHWYFACIDGFAMGTVKAVSGDAVQISPY